MRCTSDQIPAHIFRAYDIRGVVTNELTADVVHDIGLAIGSKAQEMGEKTVIVGRDGRLSGPELIQALKQGLMNSGVNVIDVGMVPTPVLYYATKVLESNSGVMLTGSHNPANYNGLKMVIAGKTMAGDDIQDLLQRLQADNLKSGSGSESSHELLDQYADRVREDVNLQKPLKVVVDCGNGVTGVLAPELIESLGCEVIPLFTEVDGNFPNHHPDPSKPKNLEDAIAAVQEHKADIGLAFDGDGDRLGVVTPSGKTIWPDRQMMLFARDALEKKPGSIILYDVKCTKNLADVITQAGGEAIMCATGHSLVKKKIAETGASLAGEMSGHIFFNDTWYGFDDALYTAARLLNILAKDARSTDEIFDALPDSITTPELNIDVADDRKFDLINTLQANADFSDATIITIDGLRVEFEDGWALVRASNTTPCFVTRFEADSTEALARIQSRFREFLLQYASDLILPF